MVAEMKASWWLLGILAVLTGGACSPAQAAIIQVGGLTSGNDCSGAGGAANCWAGQSGVQQGQPADDPTASIFVYRRDSSENAPTGAEAFGTGVPQTLGSRLVLTYEDSTNTLSFNYAQVAGDPLIRYFTIKQGNNFALFYATDPVATYSIDLDTLGFTNNRGNPMPGWSHMSFFSDGIYTPPVVVDVPEPASSTLFVAAMIGLGLAWRHRARAASNSQ
jgi:hypothetical protein